MHPPTPERPVPHLVLGPLLRHVDVTTATVWVETASRGTVTVTVGDVAASARTVTVAGHHFALVVVEGLPPGTQSPYTVAVDDVLAWPLPDDPRPAPVVRTLADPALDGTVSLGGAPGGEEDPQGAAGHRTVHPFELVFGSCRVDRPQHAPYTLPRPEHPEGVGVDALGALSRACQGGRRLPDLLAMLGDQVYADEGLSPLLKKRIMAKRGGTSEPRGEVADFEEYTWLYEDSWSDPEVRWLLSTVPTAMIFDDHDVRDDWNTSVDWRRRMAATPWWPERIRGAYMSYWLYQHLGNLSPAALADEDLWARVRTIGEDGDAEEVLREFAAQADEEVDERKPSVWSYTRDLGRTRLVVIDTRSGRMLEQGQRRMLDEEEWDLVMGQLTGDVDHLLVAASLPVLLEPALHDLEAWNAATASDAAWGRWFAPWAERLRQLVDLEHWPAFEASFHELVERLGEVAAGRHGRPPGSVLLLSGDVHHSYVAPLRFPPSVGARSPVVQLTSSPLRNALPGVMVRTFRFLHTPAARVLGRVLRRSAGLRPLDVGWRLTHGPMFGNGVASLQLQGRTARVTFARARPGSQGDDPLGADVVLRQVVAEDLTPAER